MCWKSSRVRIKTEDAPQCRRKLIAAQPSVTKTDLRLGERAQLLDRRRLSEAAHGRLCSQRKFVPAAAAMRGATKSVLLIVALLGTIVYYTLIRDSFGWLEMRWKWIVFRKGVGKSLKITAAKSAIV